MKYVLGALVLLAVASTAFAANGEPITITADNCLCGCTDLKTAIPKGWRLQYKLDDSGQKAHVDVPLITTGMTAAEEEAATLKLYWDQTIEFRTNWAIGENSKFKMTFNPTLPGATQGLWEIEAGGKSDSARGTYTGAPSNSAAAKTYTVTITTKTCTAGVKASYRISWASRLKGNWEWSYMTPSPSYVACVEIPTNNPPRSWAGNDVTYKLSQKDGIPLPEGLVFSERWGSLNGISYKITNLNPLEDDTADAIDYTVTATNMYGETTKTNLPIIVKPTKPRALWYWLHKVIDVTRGRYMHEFYPKWKCSRPTEWYIKPALPTGLKLDKNTGRIYGQPKVVTNRIKYVITGENNLGSANTIVRIRVWEAPSYLLKRLDWQPATTIWQPKY